MGYIFFAFYTNPIIGQLLMKGVIMPVMTVKAMNEFVGKPNWIQRAKLKQSYLDLYNEFAHRFNAQIEEWNSEAEDIFKDGFDKEYRLFIFEKAKSVCEGLMDKNCYGTVYFNEDILDEYGCHDFEVRLLKHPDKALRRAYKEV